MADKKDKSGFVFTLVPGTDALEAIKTPEGARALYENICAPRIAPAPSYSRQRLARLRRLDNRRDPLSCGKLAQSNEPQIREPVVLADGER